MSELRSLKAVALHSRRDSAGAEVVNARQITALKQDAHRFGPLLHIGFRDRTSQPVCNTVVSNLLPVGHAVIVRVGIENIQPNVEAAEEFVFLRIAEPVRIRVIVAVIQVDVGITVGLGEIPHPVIIFVSLAQNKQNPVGDSAAARQNARRRNSVPDLSGADKVKALGQTADYDTGFVGGGGRGQLAVQIVADPRQRIGVDVHCPQFGPRIAAGDLLA